MKNSEFVNNWILQTVRKNYADDVALVVSHSTLRIDDSEPAMSYFVPVTGKGVDLARTFILNGEGFDIWEIPWERLEGFAGLEEYNITCLADGGIMYARTPEDAERFEALKVKLRDNLKDPQKMRTCALEAYGQAKKIYLEMLFAKGSDVRLGAGYVLDYLARSIAFANQSYFKKSQTDQLAELEGMKKVPAGFAGLYLKVIQTESENVQKETCYEMIRMVQNYLLENCPEDKVCTEHNFQDLAGWYAELSYTWLRIRHYARCQDAVKAYAWGIYLQSELNQVCRDFGLEKMDLLESYRATDLEAFASCADRLEKKMRGIIRDGGGHIQEFASIEEFCAANASGGTEI